MNCLSAAAATAAAAYCTAPLRATVN